MTDRDKCLELLKQLSRDGRCAKTEHVTPKPILSIFRPRVTPRRIVELPSGVTLTTQGEVVKKGQIVSTQIPDEQAATYAAELSALRDQLAS